jgi:hypothetical protein
MAGWYSDAFSSNMSKVNTKNITSDSGLGIKEFGDAFAKIGKAMQDDELHTKKNALYDSQLKTEQLNQSAKQTELENQAEQWVQNEDDKDYIASAYKHKNEKDFKDAFKVDDTNQPSTQAMEKVKTYFKQQDNEAQNKFNDTAIKTANKYDSWDKFKTDNSELIENADGSTIQSIKSAFANTTSQVEKLKTQKTINDLKAKLNKQEIKTLQSSKENKGFKYTENTGTKITNLVKSALGMDNELTTFDDAKQKEFNTMVTEISTLSKDYSLEPNLAYKLWLEQSNKTVVKKENKDPLGLLK